LSVDKAQIKASEKVSQVREETRQVIQSKKDELKNQEIALKEQINNTVVKDLASSILSKISGIKAEIRD
jgi:hypothetical protein